jgi:hypothetical protein
MGNAFGPKVLDPPEDIAQGQFGVFRTDRAFSGFKKITCKCHDGNLRAFVAQVTIPDGARVIRPRQDPYTWYPSDKLRTDEYKIEKIFRGFSISPPVDCFSRLGKAGYKYEEGKTYKEPELNTETRSECGTPGLFFFLTYREANGYI